jgi:hypothetical protein
MSTHLSYFRLGGIAEMISLMLLVEIVDPTHLFLLCTKFTPYERIMQYEVSVEGAHSYHSNARLLTSSVLEQKGHPDMH